MSYLFWLILVMIVQMFIIIVIVDVTTKLNNDLYPKPSVVNTIIDKQIVL